MPKFVYSERLREIAATKPNSAISEADGTCTGGHDNDGSTGFEIFQNGVKLALKAAESGKDIFYAEVDDEWDNHVFVMASSEDEACELVASWPTDDES